MNRFVSQVTTRFNPFSAGSKAARLFLVNLPPDARASGMNIETTLLPRASTEPSSLVVKFKDGKEMNFDCEKLGIKGVMEEVNRHCRVLQKQADLTE